MSSFFSELRRRNVVKVAVAYAVVGWILVEVASVVLPTFKTPEWVMQTLTFLVVLGFPLALVFAWAFELTPEGLKREKDVDRSKSVTHETGKKLNYAITALLSVAVIFLVLDNYVWVDDESPAEVAQTAEREGSSNRKSIAVLPFSNRSADEENAEFFSAGIHDDLLTLLSAVRELKVISRTSVEKYKGTSKTIREIAHDLDVANIVEGGVQRAGDRVRINVQLIDASTDEHLWAQTYDRELTAGNIFDIQSEIAGTIATALQATLTPQEQSRLASVPTENFEAYEAYMLGKQRMARRTAASLREALRYYQRAVELDPGYALAHVGIADTYNLMGQYAGLTPRESFQSALPAVMRAIELNDQLGEVWTSLGGIRAFRAGDWAAAREAFDRAFDLSPNYPVLLHWYGLTERFFIGDPERGLELYMRAVELDPLSPIIQGNVAGALVELGRFEEAKDRAETMLQVDPEFAYGYFHIGFVNWYVNGNLAEAIRWNHRSIELNPRNMPTMGQRALMHLDVDDPAATEEWIRRMQEIDPDQFWPIYALARLHYYRGETDQAQPYAYRAVNQWPPFWFDISLPCYPELVDGDYPAYVDRISRQFPDLVSDADVSMNMVNFHHAINLAHVYLKTAREDEGNRLLDKAESYIRSRPRLGWSGYQTSDAEILAIRGRTDEALNALESLVEAGWRANWRFLLENNPNLESIKDELRFKAVIAKLEADVAEQRSKIRLKAEGEASPES